MVRKRANSRDVSGILLLDKPSGITSNKALQITKRLFQARKAGHTGSLDPLASGLLPICLGEATKMSGFLLNSDKIYWAQCHLGVITNTGDAEGQVLRERDFTSLDISALENVLDHFRGKVTQLPPMHSAIKKSGVPLYKLARQGIEIEREPREVFIHKFDWLSLEKNILTLRVHCSKGTYIRTLAEDIGEALGCGAHISALRRLSVGVFNIENAVTLDDLTDITENYDVAELDHSLLPMESALTDWPHVTLPEQAAYYLLQGQAVLIPRAPTQGWVRLYQQCGSFIGIGQVLDDGRVAPKRLVKVA